MLTDVLDDRTFLGLLYNTLLEREPDPIGFADWLKKLESKQLSRHQLALKFVESAEFHAKTGLFPDASEAKRDRFSELVPFDVFGAKLLVPKGSDAFIELTHGCYEPWVLPYFFELCKPGMVVIDVGASLGNFAIPAAKKVGPSGSVFAIEVSQRNVKILLRNSVENRLKNIKVIPIGVSDELGFALLPMQARTNNNVLAGFSRSEIKRLEHCDLVPLLPLDRLFAELASLDIVKMDIEGMEYKAVVGARSLIDRTRPIMFVEYSPRFQQSGSGVDGRKLLLELLTRRYRAEILHRSGPVERVDCADPLAAAEVIDAVWQRHVDEGGSHLDLCFLPEDRS